MSTIEAHFQVPEYIASGLQNGTYERVGGVVREHGTKQVVAWLREAAPDKLINFAPKLLQGGEAFAGVLNLAISVCGFSLVLNRLNKLESNLRESQELLTQVDRKLDLSFYGNFVSAIKQANAAFLMSSQENRSHSAMQAIDRLLAAQHHFTGMVDVEIHRDSNSVQNLLPTLSLAYVAEAKCYLEMEEISMALLRLQEGMEVLQPRYKQYVMQQFANPKALFMHPDCKDKIGTLRLVSAYKWLEKGIRPYEVFEREDEKLSTIMQASSIPTASEMMKEYVGNVKEPSSTAEKALVAVVGSYGYPAVWAFRSIKTKIDNAKRADQLSLLPQLPERFKQIETLIEDATRLEAYQGEVEAIKQSGFTLAQWRDLKPRVGQQDVASSLICITRRAS